MRLRVGRKKLSIVLDSEKECYLQDIAFLEDSLGLKKDGDSVVLVRREWTSNDGEQVVWLETVKR